MIILTTKTIELFRKDTGWMTFTGLTNLLLISSIYVVNIDAVCHQPDCILSCSELSMVLDYLYLSTDFTVTHSHLLTGHLTASVSFRLNKLWQILHIFWAKWIKMTQIVKLLLLVEAILEHFLHGSELDIQLLRLHHGLLLELYSLSLISGISMSKYIFLPLRVEISVHAWLRKLMIGSQLKADWETLAIQIPLLISS